jgi:hypothetical protein
MRAREITEGVLDKAKSWAHDTATNWSDTYRDYNTLKSTQAQRSALPKPGAAAGATADVLPDPGQVLVVTVANGGRYFKDATGQWFNDLYQRIPYNQIISLEQLIDQDRYQQIEDPRTSATTRKTVAATTKRGRQPSPQFRR